MQFNPSIASIASSLRYAIQQKQPTLTAALPNWETGSSRPDIAVFLAEAVSVSVELQAVSGRITHLVRMAANPHGY